MSLCCVLPYFYCYVECSYIECRYAECHNAECRYAECRSAVALIGQLSTLLVIGYSINKS